MSLEQNAKTRESDEDDDDHLKNQRVIRVLPVADIENAFASELHGRKCHEGNDDYDGNELSSFFHFWLCVF